MIMMMMRMIAMRMTYIIDNEEEEDDDNYEDDHPTASALARLTAWHWQAMEMRLRRRQPPQRAGIL